MEITAAVIVFLGGLYLILNVMVWRQTHSIPILLMQLIFYFYTFHIYWIVFLHSFNIPTGLEYISDYPFNVSLNELLYVSYAHYFFFSLVYLGAILLIAKVVGMGQQCALSRCSMHRNAILGSGIALFVIAGLFCIKDFLRVVSSGVSGYALYKSGADFGVWYPILRIVFDLAASLLVLALFVPADYMSHKKRYEKKFDFLKLLSFFMIVLFYIMVMILGDKSSLFFGVLFASCVLLAREKKARAKWLIIFIALLVIINTISILRHNPTGLSFADLMIGSALHLVMHGETVSGLSQYVLLSSNVPVYGGNSLWFLFNIFLPRFIYPFRVDDPYAYFAFQSDLSPDVGWGIHYATDWYMNFGIFGLIMGALILGAVCAYLYKRGCQSDRWIFIFSGFIASFPLSIRAGIAGIKNMVVGMALGLIVYYIACRRIVFK